ncbi:MAG: phytanoyl-CoA dioxygenase family protein [Planctomycetia bacterium]|nr:phytanoyl-CoA dioxygenase family protein [Planctomycetia bacterium]
MSTTAGSTYSLSDEQSQQYAADGFVVLRGAFSPQETAALEAEASKLWWRKDLIDIKNIRCRWQNHVETGECTFECFDPVIDISPLIGQVAEDRRILDPLAEIYGEPGCLFKDKLIYKPPGAVGYGMHQDYIAWKTFPRSFVTVLIAIDPADEENGATELFPGYHKQGSIMPEDGMYHEIPLDKIDLSRGVKLDLQPGDVAIFDGFTPHRSGPNRTDRYRRQLYLSYNALSDGGEQRAGHYAYFHEWLVARYAEYGKTETYFQ